MFRILLLAAFFAAVSCKTEVSMPGVKVKVDSNGAKVTAPGVKVEAGLGGAKVDVEKK
jgi:hypothetical protein